ncbi:hypothetical protein [Tenacibaculum geojense]|uniref:Uncharacterized protein n=1 Tax=Tenacibaculum geojense TaxID=915352 RepID=A0ABW3JUN9_9FLAO
MFLLQKSDYNAAYQSGYQAGKWIAHNPTLAVILAVVLLGGLVFGITKVVKQIRTFGE